MRFVLKRFNVSRYQNTITRYDNYSIPNKRLSSPATANGGDVRKSNTTSLPNIVVFRRLLFIQRHCLPKRFQMSVFVQVIIDEHRQYYVNVRTDAHTHTTYSTHSMKYRYGNYCYRHTARFARSLKRRDVTMFSSR